MSRARCHELFRAWENDPALYADRSLFRPYRYSAEAVDRYYDAKQDGTRVLFAITVDGKTVGELQLKNIDPAAKECTMSIHLQNDSVKGRGYGTAAEKLALAYAFEVMGLNAVNADTVIGNTRSRHVLLKAGFRFVREDGTFRYYRAEKDSACTKNE